MDALSKLRAEVEDWVAVAISTHAQRIKQLAAQRKLPRKDETKVVREAVLGYQVLKPYEYLIIDSPVVQRLRYIHQTALSYLLYPTAKHTRFDHSLGVAKLAGDISDCLEIEAGQKNELRLAGLLHDVGTAFFSHLTEGTIQQRFDKDFLEIKRDPNYSDRAVGEILSHLIVTSKPFKEFVTGVLAYYDENSVDLDRVAQLLIGKPANVRQFAFMADIITGPFDADKLDYLVRDCYFTGIRSDVDIQRIMLSCGIVNISRVGGHENRNLIIRSAGVSNLEQVVFAKMLLYPAIYHHHKVRAIECMVKSVFEQIWDHQDKIGERLLRFENVTDFLRCTEYEFLSLGMREALLKPIITKLLNRDLLERCLVFSPRYVEKDPKSKTHDLVKLGEHVEENYPVLRDMRETIRGLIPKKLRPPLSELWVDLPKSPNINKDADRCWVDTGTANLMTLSEVFPYARWVDSYEASKWKGYIFCTDDLDMRKAVNKAALEYLKGTKGIELSRRATEECKLD